MRAATITAVSVNCRRCGEPISTRARAGNTIRCPSCGHAQRLQLPGQISPLGAAGTLSATAAPVPVWDAPSGPQRASITAEPCERCQEPLYATPRGTWRGCGTCASPTTPPAVRTPYARGEAASQRQVKSQAERDLEVLALEDRKGPMLDQLDALACDDKLDTASVRKVGWFREQVESARSDARLDELAGLYPRAGIRRRRWWNGEPVAELDSGGYDGDGQDDDDSRAATGRVPAGAVDYVAELAARNWVLKPHGPGICHVLSRGWAGSPDPCARRANCVIPGGAVCDHHHRALTTPLARRSA